MEEQSAPTTSAPTSLAWRKRLVVLTSVLVVVAIGARVALAKNEARQPDGAAALTADEQPPERSGIDKLMPFITEAGIAFLIGIAAGIATRFAAKMVIGVILLIFLGVQFLAYKGLIDVSWGGVWHNIKDFVLNISDSSDFKSIAKHKVPSIAAFVIGYVLGLKR